MKIYSIIPYWLNGKTGETRTNKEWLYFKIANSYDEVYQWALTNKDEIFFRADYVYKPNEIDETDLNFDFSIKEVSDILINDLEKNEYRVKLDLFSKIEIKKIEVPIIIES
jgi:hypothetical protein